MIVKQISIFIENKSGRLAKVTKILADAEINIRALSLADTADFGVLRLIVNNPEKALKSLKENDFTVNETDVLAVEVPDHPGGLSSILEIFEKNKLNVEYMYAFVEKHKEKAIMVFRFDDVNIALESLKNTDVNILSGKQIYNL